MPEDIQDSQIVELVQDAPAAATEVAVEEPAFVGNDAYKELEAFMLKNAKPAEVTTDPAIAPVDAPPAADAAPMADPPVQVPSIITPDYDKVGQELGLVKDGDQLVYEITPEDITGALNENYKHLGFEFKDEKTLEDILVDYNQLKTQSEQLSQISKEDLNMLLAIKKVGIQSYGMISSVSTEGKSPEEILWTQYQLDHPKKSSALAKADFQREVMDSFENYESPELKSEAIEIASQVAKQKIDARKSELATLAPDIAPKQTGPSQEEIKARQDAYADQYFSLVDRSLGEIKEILPQSIRNEKGEEIGKMNIALSKEEKEYVQKALDYSVNDYLHRGVDLSKLNINQTRDAIISSIIKDKAVYEAYKQGMSDKEANDLKRNLGVNVDIQSPKQKDDSAQRPMTLQEKEAWFKQQNPRAFN